MADYTYAGVSLTRVIAAELITGFCHERPVWKAAELYDRTVDVHLSKGGTPPRASRRKLQSVMLRTLCKRGVLGMVTYGIYRATLATPNISMGETVVTETPAAAAPIALQRVLPPVEKELGDGAEAVYVYYMSKPKRRSVWPCKIGRTEADAIERIMVQANIYPLPIIGLVIKTDCSADLETLLHCWLRMHDRGIPDAPGQEWFMTSPAEVMRVYKLVSK